MGVIPKGSAVLLCHPSSMFSGGNGDFDASSMPNGGNFDASSMPGGGSFGAGSSSSGKTSRLSGTLTYNDVTYTLTDETNTTYIPVGVVVTTKLGTETTFSRISAGDCLALVTEVIDGVVTIISVYIVG